MKTKQVTLVRQQNRVKNHTHDEFLVVSAQDQTDFLPGSIIFKPEVDGLCRNNSWKVKIIQGKKS